MNLIDLTLPSNESASGREAFQTEEKRISNPAGAYTGIVHHFRHNSMVGTYIDFPSHVKETDDGSDACNYPPEKIFRVPAAVIHLGRASGSGKIGADELAVGSDWMYKNFKDAAGPACPSSAREAHALPTGFSDQVKVGRGVPAAPSNLGKEGALILNALAKDQVAGQSVYLGREAVNWISRKGFHLLISDVYESSSDPQNVFPDLFRNGVATVCCPVNLHLLTEPGFRVTVLFPRFVRATQLPCRVLVETGLKE